MSKRLESHIPPGPTFQREEKAGPKKKNKKNEKEKEKGKTFVLASVTATMAAPR